MKCHCSSECQSDVKCSDRIYARGHNPLSHKPTDESVGKSREGLIRYLASSKGKKAKSASSRMIGNSPDVVARKSAAMKSVCANPEYKERMRRDGQRLMKEVWARAESKQRRLALIERNKSEGMREKLRTAYATGRRRPTINPACLSTNGGYMQTRKAGRVFCRSSWEKLFFSLLDSSPLVRRFTVEPFGIPYLFNGETHTYFPDCWLITSTGDKFVIEVKGWGEDLPKNQAKFDAAAHHCEKIGARFLTIIGEQFANFLRHKNPVSGLLQ